MDFRFVASVSPFNGGITQPECELIILKMRPKVKLVQGKNQRMPFFGYFQINLMFSGFKMFVEALKTTGPGDS